MESNLLAEEEEDPEEGEDQEEEEDIYLAALDGLDEASYRRRVAAEEQLGTHRLDAHLEASGLALNLAPSRPP